MFKRVLWEWENKSTPPEPNIFLRLFFKETLFLVLHDQSIPSQMSVLRSSHVDGC